MSKIYQKKKNIRKIALKYKQENIRIQKKKSENHCRVHTTK